MKQTTAFWRYSRFVFSVGGAQVFGLLITSLTFPYLVRRLGVETYGLWNYVVAACGFLDVVANPGLGTYTKQQVAAQREGASNLIPNVLALRTLSSLLATVLLLLIASLESRTKVRLLFYWYGIGILVVNLVSSNYLLTALELFHSASLLTIVQQALYAAGIFMFVRSGRDIFWLAGSILISSFFANLAGWVILWQRGFRINGIIDPRQWKKILVPSAHYALSTLMSNLYNRTGHIVVRWFLGERALGLYAAAIRLVEISRHFALIILSVLMPRMALAAKTEAELVRLARFAFVVVAAVSIPLTFGLIATSHLIVPWLMGSKYMEDIQLLRWTAPYIVTASAASLLSGTILYAMGRHRAYLASACSGAIAGMLLYLLLTMTMGLVGSCLAFVLAELVVAVVAYAFVPRGVRSFWKSSVIAYILLSSLGMLVVVRIIETYTSNPLMVIPIGALAYAAISFHHLKKWIMNQLSAFSSATRPLQTSQAR